MKAKIYYLRRDRYYKIKRNIENSYAIQGAILIAGYILMEYLRRH